MSSISERIKEIDDEITRLYNEKRILEFEQQEEWKEKGYSRSLFLNASDDKITNNSKFNLEFDSDWSGSI